MSSALDNILGSLPTDQIAERVGLAPDTAKPVIGEALEALLSGLSANSTDEAGAASLAKALTQHSGDLVDGGVNLADINEEDGNKIVANIFGDNKDSVIATLGAKGSGDESIISKLMPMLAPVVMGYLSKQLLGNKSAGAGQADSGGGIGDMLGGLLGGDSNGGGLGDMLGGMFGGAKNDGGLGDMLGGLLGGGKYGGGGGIGDMLGGLLGGGKR